MMAAIVPAAGMSTRMGLNKLLLTFDGKTLIEHVLDILLSSHVDEIVVVVGHEAKKMKEKLKGRLVKVISNPNYRQGLSTSIRAGFKGVSSKVDAIMIYLADQPLLEPSDLNLLIEAFAEAKKGNKSIVVPFYRGQQGYPVIVASKYKRHIMNLAGDICCRGLIKQNPDEVLAVEMENDHVVRDINTVEDYEELLIHA